MLAADRVERQILANGAVEHKFDATLGELIDAGHDRIFLELEARNAIGQEATGAVIPVIDRDLNTLAAQRIGGGKAGWAGTDDANAFGPLGTRGDRLDPTLGPSRIGQIAFDRADGHGAVARLLDHAVAFAEAILWADATADLGEGIGGLTNLIGLLQAALGG